jgi:hypothetical protein
MNHPIELEVRCEDFLKDNQHFYAHKARRRKIALIRFEANNMTDDEVRLLLDDSELFAGGQLYALQGRNLVIRKLSEFTWDFLFYLILDFHPLLAAIDLIVLLFGPLYNWRLERQLHALVDHELVLKPGERHNGLLGFHGLPAKTPPEKLRLAYSRAGAPPQQLQCEIA